MISGRLLINWPHSCINQVKEKAAGYDKPLYIAFIYYEKVLHRRSTGSMKDQGIEEAYTNLLDGMLYKICTGRVILRKKNEKFLITKRVLQPVSRGFFRNLEREK